MIELLNQRIKDSGQPLTFWCKELGFSQSVLWRWLHGEREVNLNGVRKLAAYFIRDSDGEMLRALISYALGLDSCDGEEL